MARLKAFRIEGLRLFFHMRDHQPPHFHASRPGHWEYRVFLLEDRVEPVFMHKRPMSGRLRRTLSDLVARHRTELLDEWDRSREG